MLARVDPRVRVLTHQLDVARRALSRARSRRSIDAACRECDELMRLLERAREHHRKERAR